MAKPKEDSPGGNSTWGKPRKDRKAVKKAQRVLDSKGKVSAKRLNKVASIVESSRLNGTLNAKDRTLAGNLAKNVRDAGFVTKEGAPGTPEWEKTQRYAKAVNALNLVADEGAYNSRNEKLGKPKATDPTFSGGQAPKGKGKTKAVKVSKGSADGHNHKDNKNGKGGKGGKGGGSRGGRGGQGYLNYNPIGDYQGVSRKEAAAIVNRDAAREIRSIGREARNMRDGFNYDVNKINALHDRTVGDLNKVWGETIDYQGGRSQLIADQYANTGNQLAQFAQNTLAQQQQGTQNTRNAAMAEMERLGIQQSGMGTYDADANFLQALGQQASANNQSAVGMQAAMSADMGATLQAMSRGALASAVGRAGLNRQDATNDLRQAFRGDMRNIRDIVREIRMGRKDATNELWQLLDQNAFNKYRDMADMNFQNNLAASQFNFNVDKFHTDTRLAKAKLEADWEEARSRRKFEQRKWKRSQAGVNKASNSVLDVLNNAVGSAYSD